MEAAEGFGGGGAGGPSRRPPRRGLPRPAPYGQTPRRLFPKLPLASRILQPPRPSSSTAREPTDRENEHEDRHETDTVMSDHQSGEPDVLDAPANGAPISAKKNGHLPLEGDYRNQNDGNAISEIEEVIKQKTFSRGQLELLIDIIRSRTPDFCHEDQTTTGLIAKDVEVTPFSKDFGSFSKPVKQVNFQSTWKASDFAHSKVHDVGSSPIEIAKAYMEAQVSGSVHESPRKRFTTPGDTVNIDNSASTHFRRKAANSPVYWPGSIVQEYPNYLTPQSNRRRTMHQTFSRTPYSGSVSPRSLKARAEDRSATVGGVRAQASTSSHGIYADNTASSPFMRREGSAALKNLPLNFGGACGKGAAESRLELELPSVEDDFPKCAVGSVHPKSSLTAQKIFQHLERAIPSPVAKSLELKQIAGKRAAASTFSDSQDNRLDSTTPNGHRPSSNSERDTVNQDFSDAKKVQAAPSSSNANQFIPRFQNSGSNSQVSPMPTAQNLFSAKSAPISTSATVFSDKSTSNGFTFTFHVTTASTSLMEPPPPPTMTSLPASSPPVDGEDVPKFTFGSSSSKNNLVFSFDSDNSSVGADATMPNFKFGSDEKRELSFSGGTDGVCY